MKIKSYFFLTAVVFLCFAKVNAQTASISVSPTATTYDIFPTSSFNFADPEFSTVYFTLNVTASIPSVTVRVDVALQSQIATGALASGTALVPLNASGNGFTKTLSSTRFNDLMGNSYQIDDNVQTDIEDAILETSLVPSGQLTFTFTVLDGGNVISNSPATLVMTLQNNTQLNLLSPNTGDVSSTTFPFFQWASDLNDFDIIISETYSDPLGEAGEANLNSLVFPAHKNYINGSSLQFPANPAAGGRHLQQGKKYYWQIIANANTPSGNAQIRSEIWEFTVADGSGSGTSGSERQIVQDRTKNALISGADNSGLELGNAALNLLDNATLQQILSGQGTSETPLTFEQILQILEAIENGNYEVISITVE
ncbi:MAG: hypothetical protein DWQ06_04210 [Calditrichaeota bacterium]|nr:MAG: hypothetical protein DWQ06_04210 [Calditrichota bacterium]